MISENITEQQFIVQVLERDIWNIYKAQLVIARSIRSEESVVVGSGVYSFNSKRFN